MQYSRLSAFLLVSAMVIVSACTEGGTSIIQDKQVYTIDDQEVIGDHFSQTIKSDPAAYDLLNANAYPEVSEYLNTIFRSAVISEHVTTRADFTWELLPLIDDEVYAYSMPGGKVVISTGMLKTLQFESELMAILSHEIYYTDINLHTVALKDEYSGIRMGSISLGNDDDSSDLIQFLKDQSFSESEVMNADVRAISVLCPFNYDINSLQYLVNRSVQLSDMSVWMDQRPRSDDWELMISAEVERCGSDSDERFYSRYQDMIATLP